MLIRKRLRGSGRQKIVRFNQRNVNSILVKVKKTGLGSSVGSSLDANILEICILAFFACFCFYRDTTCLCFDWSLSCNIMSSSMSWNMSCNIFLQYVLQYEIMGKEKNHRPTNLVKTHGTYVQVKNYKCLKNPIT